MALEIKVGSEIPVSGAVKGKSSKGPYFKATVKAERGYDKIDVWASNPGDAINITGMAKVVAINAVKLGAHQYNNKWYTDYTIEAKLTQGSAEEPFPDFLQMEDADPAELPFD